MYRGLKPVEHNSKEKPNRVRIVVALPTVLDRDHLARRIDMAPIESDHFAKVF